MNLLIIEDYKECRDCIVESLKHADLNAFISSASSYDEAVKISENIEFDVILSDIILDNGDGKDGDDFCREYKKNHPETRIFLVTGKGISKVSDLDYEEIYDKPFKTDLFLSDLANEEMMTYKNNERCQMHENSLYSIEQKCGMLVDSISELNENVRSVTNKVEDIEACLIGSIVNGKWNEGKIQKIESNQAFNKWMSGILTAVLLAVMATWVKSLM